MKHSFLLLLTTATFIICISGCGLGGIKDTATNVTNQISQDLDQAISALNSQSANWQDVLNKAITNLPKEASDLIRGDLNNLLQRTVAAAGSEGRCDADFFRNRVQQSLVAIKAKLLNQQAPPLPPQFCSAVPSAVDMSLPANSRNKVDFYGYDFDKATEHVFLVNGSQRQDVSQFLHQSTHYQMTLNLGGNGVPLGNNSQSIVLSWNNQDVSSIPVIQPSPKICETDFVNITPNQTTYIPPRVGGDAEFDGNGPNVNCSVMLHISSDRTKLLATIYMDAKETESDWTEARGQEEIILYQADPGMIIESIVSPAQSSFAYTDSNHSDDRFGGNGCIASFTFVGDVDGDDAGIATKVTLVFNSIRLQLKENANCVSSETIKSLIKENKISSSLKMKVH